MMRLSATYIREGDYVYAFHGDTLITRASTFKEAEKTAVEYLDHIVSQDKKHDNDTDWKKSRFVETPNGLKGEILGNVQGVWGEDELTVRWENGRISKYETRGKDYKYSTEDPSAEPESAVDYLTGVLSSTYEHDKTSLLNRIKELDGVVAKVAKIISAGDLPAADERTLDGMALTAEHEQNEVREALAHLEQADYEAFAPPQPFQSSAVEQADLGGHNGSWLEETVNDMIREANDQDFDRLLLEGPGQFVVDVDTPALADQGVTAQLAQTFIESKTAGLVGDAVEDFRKQFLAKVELARRQELKERERVARTAAETKAASAEDENATDEGLFL